MSALASIRHDIDVTDAFYEAEHDYYDGIMPSVMEMDVAYTKKMLTSRFRGYLEEKIGSVAFKNFEISERSYCAENIPLQEEENRLTSRYDKLIATARIPWHGEELNISLLTPYLTSCDRQTRIEAWEALDAFFSKNEEELDDIYDRLVKNRTKQGNNKGYENYLPLGYDRMQRNCYGRADVKLFREQVKRDFVPYVQSLQEKRRKRIGVDRLMCWDGGVYFPGGNPKPTGTPEEILAAGQRMYAALSPETHAFMDFMCENELFDVLGRKNKTAGGYQSYLPAYKAPFVFANFNGTSGDVDVITHECGHAFQAYIAAQDPIREHANITMETAETHSMSMEFFTNPWMGDFFGDRAQDFLEMQLESACIFIPYGTMVDEFQDIIYSDPGLSPAERKKVWLDLEQEYRPGQDYGELPFFVSGGFWQKQKHIYDYPLYYIDYVIAQVDALQYRAWMQRDRKAAWESYLELCRLSASDFFTGLLKKVKLTSPFEEGSFNSIVCSLK